MNSGLSTRKTVCWGVPPENQNICGRIRKQWLLPSEDWRVLNVVSGTVKPPPPPPARGIPQVHNYNGRRRPAALPQVVAATECRQWKTPKSRRREQDPIWKRRGAKPIACLNLNPVIRGDLNWAEKAGNEELMHIVNDKEWVMTKPDYYEAHSLSEMTDGVVIDPPTYSAAYTIPSAASKRVPAVLPESVNILFWNALQHGYAIESLISTMGGVIKYYSVSLIHPKRRHYQEILILANPKIWQGVTAVTAATKLVAQNMRVSVLLVDDGTDHPSIGAKEIAEYTASGGKVYTNLQDLIGLKFRVVVAAFEDQHSAGRSSTLFKYGEWLQHAVVVFVDPPILKCSYSTALQLATRGCYNMCQKTILLVPFYPKPYIPDNFVDVVVVDGGISQETQLASGLTSTVFPRRNGSKVEVVVPVDFSVTGSQLYFYKHGKRLLS